MFLFHLWLVPSSAVAGIADLFFLHAALFVALPSFNSACVISLLHASFHIGFGRPLLLFPGMSTSNIRLTMCSSVILTKRSCYFSRILSFSWTRAPLVLFLSCVHFGYQPFLSLRVKHVQSYNCYDINEGCYLFDRGAIVKLKLFYELLAKEYSLLFSVNLEEYLHEAKR